ncbi:hypothetical protein [uncultured Brevundimonas sp.]|uniref:hypothetical protein n=1 Tax=uncultured Brevundimonas sp. TaxID=213418 RepID=UPI002639A50E|nr:hypothetical protein [uncultured Brevundimonas sp.]
MTPFVALYLIVSLVGVALIWVRGGHPERMGAVFWLVAWMFQMPLNDLRLGDLRWGVALVDLASFAAFVWLALRHERWWPIAVSACLLLTVATHLFALLVPGGTPRGEASAQLGFGLLAIVTQVAGVLERWLAGETPASAAATWKRICPSAERGQSSAGRVALVPVRRPQAG